LDARELPHWYLSHGTNGLSPKRYPAGEGVKPCAVNAQGQCPMQDSAIFKSGVFITEGMSGKKTWDFFIAHALEDKRDIARPLADALNVKGLISWHADYGLKLGDNLRESIDYGLSRSRFGIVILSRHFFDKRFTRDELNDLAIREVDGKYAILPIWHKIGFQDVLEHCPLLAERVAISTDKGLAYVLQRIAEAAK
jgi:hypothetical protein